MHYKKMALFLVSGMSALLLHSGTYADANESATEIDSIDNKEFVTASWKEHNARFFYSSFDTYFSCSGIETSLKNILEKMGATDVKVRAAGCGPSQVERTIPLRVSFKALTLGEGDEKGNSVAAHYKELDFSELYKRRTVRDATSNCDLIRDVEKELLESFEHELLRSQSICNYSYSVMNDVKLQVKILMPINNN